MKAAPYPTLVPRKRLWMMRERRWWGEGGEAANFMGIPKWHPTHALLSADQRKLCGRTYADQHTMQDILAAGLHMEPVKAVMMRALELAGMLDTPNITLATAYAGAGMAAIALDLIRPSSWTYLHFTEISQLAIEIHKQVTDAMGQTPTHLGDALGSCALNAHTADMWFWTTPCAPYTRENADREEASKKDIVNIRKASKYIENAHPRIVIFENTDSWHTIKTEPQATLTRELEQEIFLPLPYTWYTQIVGPSTHCRFPVKRDRVFYVGIRNM